MSNERLKIGITIGDLNGIGAELILKTFSDPAMLEICTPIIYGAARVLSFYKKISTAEEFVYHAIKSADEAQHGKTNLINLWQEEVKIEPGVSSEISSKYAIQSIEAATKDLIAGKVHAVVTAPIEKTFLEKNNFKFPGHTEYFAQQTNSEPVMLMVHDNLRVGLVTGHIGVKDVSTALSKEKITKKLKQLKQTLKQDFSISKPKIAVLGLNPHAGDNDKFGKEESEIIKPAIEEATKNGDVVVGPFSADGFFASGKFKQFDAILAMYHDQGLIPFKTLSGWSGVNFSAGMPVVRTSPDHGPAFEIAGKDCAEVQSFRDAIYLAIDVYNTRNNNAQYSKNPLKKLSTDLLKAQDEPFIEDNE